MPTITEEFHFYTTPEYFAELAKRVAASGEGDRVIVSTMTFQPGRKEVRRIMTELCSAARRGASVLLIIDAKPFLLPGGTNSVGVIPGPLFFNVELPIRLKKRFKSVLSALEELKDSGGVYRVVNQPGKRFRNPLIGRSHIKFAIVGDQVFTGGCNLDTDAHFDIMVGWKDKAVADWLAKLANKIAVSGSVRLTLKDEDIRWDVNETTTLIVDSGVRGKSIILQEALETIDAAEEFIVISSQFFPNDATARHLLAAHKRGVKVQVFYNHPSQFGLPHNLLHYGVIEKAKWSLPKSFFVEARKGNFLHTKLVVTERAALVGSHNFVPYGVKLGTAEMDLISSDPDFIRRLLGAFMRQVEAVLPV